MQKGQLATNNANIKTSSSSSSSSTNFIAIQVLKQNFRAAKDSITVVKTVVKQF